RHPRCTPFPYTTLFRSRIELDDVERTDAGRALHDEEGHDHTGQQADVTRARRQEGLQRGVAVRFLLPPVADQHERAHTDELPAEDRKSTRLNSSHVAIS